MINNDYDIKSICEKTYKDDNLDKQDIVKLLTCSHDEAKDIFTFANEVRQKEMGDKVHLRGLIEFSNHCKRNCSYCGLRRDNRTVQRYRLDLDEILQTAKNAESLGYRSVVLQSGEDPYFTIEKLVRMIDLIKSNTDLAVTLSIGEFDYNDYTRMKEAGADRYLLRFETADRDLYSNIHPDSDYEERLECLQSLRQAGFQVGSGFMVGLPGETPEIMAENLLLLRKLDLDMAGIGPFLPNPSTPLANEQGGNLLNSLRAVALARLLLRNAHIPATTAMGSLDPKGREKALDAGANVVMPNVTPQQYREMYLLYPNKICLADDPAHCRGCITGKIKSLGRTVAEDHGHSLKSHN